ncbi:hypothetical protein LJR016_004864 [Devosia sp. LjRoot16]|uniref:hypothetical protein n=1 Tax=Devosia sp. LjRoot16 TaxID=3342271 RepID=UPI003ECC720B
MLRMSMFAAAVLGLLSTPVLAQDAVDGEEAVDSFVLPAFNGIAVSQAPEAGLGVCFGPFAADAMDCAVAQCVQQSGLSPEECSPNLWCYPHGWVADIFMQHNEGPHWHKFVCDQNDQMSLEAIVTTECAKDFLLSCELVRIWDNEGQQVFGEGADPQLPPPPTAIE